MTPTAWNLAPPPGFRGLDPAKPLTVYYRHLPHWRQDGATYFVTFRLADSLPKEKLQELALHTEEWERKHQVGRIGNPSHDLGATHVGRITNPSYGLGTTHVGRIANPSYEPHGPQPRSDKDWEEFAKQTTARVEAWLDQGMGACWLRQPWAAKIIDEALHFFDGARYELACFVIMPNHVHAIIRPLQPAVQPLEKILQSRKRTTAARINKALGKDGELWQEESFDRIIRDEEHLYRCIQYIGNNPRRAQLPKDEWRRWLRPEWQALGWRFEE